MHRDLKPDNLAISAGFHLKIIDFGHARVLSEKAPQSKTDYVIARNYRAPEVLFKTCEYNTQGRHNIL